MVGVATLLQAIPTGGIDDVELTAIFGALLALVGGAALIVETGTLLYREYVGRTRFHRPRATAVRNTVIAATVFGLGVAILLTTDPQAPLP